MARCRSGPPRRQPNHARDCLRRCERRRTLGRRRRQRRRTHRRRQRPQSGKPAALCHPLHRPWQHAHRPSMLPMPIAHVAPSLPERRGVRRVRCAASGRLFWPMRSLYPRLRASPRRACMLPLRSGDDGQLRRRLRLLAGYLRARQRQCPVLRVSRRKLQLPLRSCRVHGMLSWNVQLGIACHRVHELPQGWLVSRGRRLLRPRLSSVHGRHVQSQHGRREQRIVPCLSTWQGQSGPWQRRRQCMQAVSPWLACAKQWHRCLCPLSDGHIPGRVG